MNEFRFKGISKWVPYTKTKGSMMPVINKDIIQGRWAELKGKIKQQWGKLTDDDILKMKGSTQELHGILQEKYGYEKAQAEKEVQDFIDKNKPDSDK